MAPATTRLWLANIIERLARIPVEVDYASEYRYRKPLIEENHMVLAITQSGETVDTLAALEEANRAGLYRGDRQRRGQPGGPRLRRRDLHAGRAGDRRRQHQGIHGFGHGSFLLAVYLGQERGMLDEAERKR